MPFHRPPSLDASLLHEDAFLFGRLQWFFTHFGLYCSCNSLCSQIFFTRYKKFDSKCTLNSEWRWYFYAVYNTYCHLFLWTVPSSQARTFVIFPQPRIKPKWNILYFCRVRSHSCFRSIFTHVARSWRIVDLALKHEMPWRVPQSQLRKSVLVTVSLSEYFAEELSVWCPKECY